MKKLISLLLLFAILISCCACTGDPTETTDNTESSAASTEATEATEPTTSGLQALTPEQLYGHINQLEPVDGVYKIWSEVGVQNMADHPDGKFELLCNVDMQGATLTPIGTADKPFTGEINGANFSISNFTLQGGDETDFGFVTVNKGTIEKLLIKEVTFVPGANAQNIGSLAGSNEGQINRCEAWGDMNVEAAAENANVGGVVGLNTGSLTNTVVEVNVNVTAAGAANVGGIVGTANGGTIEFIDTTGKLDTVGTNKNYGLFAGQANDVVLKTCAFVGASNTVDGVLQTNFTGNPDDDELQVALKALWRDNEKPVLTEGQNKLRDRVVQEMNAMGTVEWHLHEDLRHACTCQLSVCHGVYNTTYTYYGIPYNHKGGSLTRFNYAIDDEGYVEEWLYGMDEYDGFDLYIGNDCSTALSHAWWTVSNSTDFSRVTYQIPALMNSSNFESGCIPVGTGWWEDLTLTGGNNWTDDYITVNGDQVMMEAYAQMRKGDGYAYIIEAGGHTRMAVEDPVVVRDQQGLIDPTYSYVITTEQGSTTVDDVNMTYSTWKVNYKYTFGSLLADWAVPMTCEELLTGEMEPAECELLDGVDGMAGIYTGTVKANYYLDSVNVTIVNSKGEEVMNQTMFTTVDKRYDLGHNDGLLRNYVDEYDLVSFATPLSKVALEKGETYTYTITGNVHTYDSFVVKEASFVYGSAQ